MAAVWSLFITSLLVGLSGAVTPGPLLSAVIADVARSGFWAAPLLVLGHVLLELVVVLGLARGLAEAVRRPTVLRTVAGLGGLALLILGADMLRAAWHGSLQLTATDAIRLRQTAALPLLTGVVVSIGNPYWLLWWATVGAGYTAVALRRGAIGLGAFYTGHVLADFSWYILIALLVVAGRQFFTPNVYRAIVGIAGVFLVGMGLFFLRTAAQWSSAKLLAATLARSPPR